MAESNRTLDRVRQFDSPLPSIDHKQIIYPAIVLVAFIGLWTGIVWAFELPTYILPTPLEIAASFQGEWGSLYPHVEVTLIEAGFGWLLGNLIGVVLGFIMSRSKPLQTALYPYLIGFRSIPIIAIAPLLILWMGLNITPILATATITTFFPTLVNSIAGFNATDPLTKELMRSLDASWWQYFKNVQIYNALPYIFSSLKITVALSMIGAIVGEWISANKGLGYLVILAHNQIDTLLMFRVLLLISLLGTVWFGLITLLERKLVSWDAQGSVTR